MDTVQIKLVALVNKERAHFRLPPYTEHSLLTRMAEEHVVWMAKNNLLTHGNLSARLRQSSYPYRSAGENIAAGQYTPESAMRSWMLSSGHRANILSSKYKEIGVASVVAKNGRIYWCQVFGARR